MITNDLFLTQLLQVRERGGVKIKAVDTIEIIMGTDVVWDLRRFHAILT